MDEQQLRKKMIDEQLIGRGIRNESVINAMADIPRHEFVPDTEKKHAYQDGPLPIGQKQTISQPYIVALMTQALNLTAKSDCLEIGTGSGYQTAILAQIGNQVNTIERISSLGQKAKEKLDQLQYKNINFYIGDGSDIPDHFKRKYQAIMFTAALPQNPSNFYNWLDEEGILVAPIGDRIQQKLTVFKKKDAQISSHVLCGCIFVPLIGKFGWN